MIMATDWRQIGSIVLAAGALLAPGCGKPAPGTGDKKPPTLNVKGANDSKQNSPADPKTATDSEKAHPQVFYGDFIKALFEGNAVPDQFTPAFLKKIARPDPKDEEQLKLGYNKRKFFDFLDRMRVGAPPNTLIMEEKCAEGPFFYGVFRSPLGKEEGWLIRLVRADKQASGWQIDWIQRSTAKGPSWNDKSLGPELIGAQLALHEFLENLLGGDLTLAEAAMSTAMKVDWAYSSADSFKDQGYDSAFLQNLRLLPLRNGFMDFTIASRIRKDVNGKAAVLIAGELINVAKKNETKKYEMAIAKSKDGDWLVEDFKVR